MGLAACMFVSAAAVGSTSSWHCSSTQVGLAVGSVLKPDCQPPWCQSAAAPAGFFDIYLSICLKLWHHLLIEAVAAVLVGVGCPTGHVCAVTAHPSWHYRCRCCSPLKRHLAFEMQQPTGVWGLGTLRINNSRCVCLKQCGSERREVASSAIF